MQKVLIIVGPTGVGKTSLSIKLAKKLNGEVISGDSMQVYKHLDIGTAKVTKEESEGIVHHLIDIIDVDKRYSAADFVESANKLIEDIHKRGKLPIIVGGTGFYIQSLVDGLNLGGDHYDNEEYRNKMHSFAEEFGKHALWLKLNSIDELSAQKIDEENERRVIRALEVYHNTGVKFSEQTNNSVKIDPYIIALNTDRKVLYNRINKRVDVMFKEGLIDEAKWLDQKGDVSLPAYKGIGYREFINYFHGDLNLEDVSELIKKDSRHYAKRQLTWFRNKMKVNWYDIISNMEVAKNIEKDVINWLIDKKLP
ncbi:tRNA (adenosine(37)-N6)-dimethylallyltransferase MiaA [Apilactobacillus kunkeei]|uniref:tRNA (adenosine(37)-N6)-dimethylallyltransferase MiaA n=1 Tax=Apilactobacillus kunkeei TaxID=148814 RepID=UPI00110CB1AE|nr:tRNA (adenosine(37)-N6)-dimethylallyltransferase MiaA [Apilactobacillus kunkeei]TMS99158.1 tRNA (adenosine(37)-N6)-dimethylallyltransferase MiaA [Apilactobacillus kunkeei]